MPICGTSERLSPVSVESNVEDQMRRRLSQIHDTVPDSICDALHFSVAECSPEAGRYRLRCQTAQWMRNPAGTLHGGLCATILDQAMGIVAFCVKSTEGFAPTLEMQISYHRPLIPGEDVLVTVEVLSVSRNVIHLRAEAFCAAAPEKLCASSTAIYFVKGV